MGTLLLALPALFGLIHDDSASFSRVEVGDEGVHVSLRVQALSVLEVLPWLDRDGDQLISAEELSVRPAELGRYLLQNYSLAERGRPLQPEDFPQLLLDPASALPGSWIEARWSAPTSAPLTEIELDVNLFVEESPGHLEFTEVTWRGTDLHPFTLGPGGGDWSFRPPSSLSAVLSSVKGLPSRGSLLPVLLLCAALGCSVFRPWRSMAIALSGMMVGVVWVRVGGGAPSGRTLQLSAALGAAYLATDLALLDRSRPPLFEACTFGLLAGLAFAVEAASRLRGQVHGGLQVWAELAAGSAVGALACGALVAVKPHGRRRVLAAGLALVGLGLFAQRTF